tara:strand:- start:530 stop:1015 length:486 start_codon:yes stop_codon:yes gene_type:complete
MKRRIYDFNELNHICSKHYKDKGYCGVIATSVAAQVSVGKARGTLHGKQHVRPRKLNKGTYMPTIKQSLKDLGCDLVNILMPASPDSVNCGAARYSSKYNTLGKTCRELPTDGVYLVHTTRHITCVEYGQIIDWASSSSKYKVVDIYKVERQFEEIKRKAI